MRLNNAALASAISGEARSKGGGSRLVSNDGHVNGSSKADLLSNLVFLSQEIASGRFDGAVEEVASAEEHRAELCAAHAAGGAAWAELGSGISADITEAVGRQGFMRRLLARGDVAQGSIPRVRTRIRHTEAVVATGPSAVQTQWIRDGYVMPEEFNVQGRLAVEDRELAQGSGDIMTERYNEGLEAFMVQEDRTLLKQLALAATIYNSATTFSGAFSPANISAIQYEVSSWSIPVSSMLMSHDLLQDLQSAGAWANYLEPVSKLEINLTGRLATLYGVELLTDGFRQTRLRVMPNGTIYCVTAPEMLGAYTDRGPIQATPLDASHLGVPGKGWHMSELISQAVSSPKGVSVARRA